VNPYRFPLALFAFLGFVAVIPAWSWFMSTYTADLPTETTFLAGLVLPATLALFLASWLQGG
jgi:hypothetical protein